MRFTIKILCLLFFIQSSAQTIGNQEKITNYIEAYFHYDRENIHVQFNKNIYINDEDLAFKGYVWSKNNNAPNVDTNNIQLIIYNEKDEIVLKQLLFSSNGCFSGGIHLNDKLFKAGKYTFHFYTNWMNNFKEDDSFTQVIEIINRNDPYAFKTNEPNWASAKITLFPEGGSIINDITNAIGVNIKDCNNKGIQTEGGIVLDSHSNEVAHFHTNAMGNGAFFLTPKINESYTLKVTSNKLKLVELLPKTQETGIIVTYNNNLAQNKLIVQVKTNEKGVELYQNKKFILLMQQDGKFIQQEINFNNKALEQKLLFDKQKLSPGVNSIRLIDENLNEITERLIYINPTTSPTTILYAKTIAEDSIQLFGKTELNQANLSINVLPENNICMNQKRSIKGTFYLNAYLEKPEIDNYAYYDLDNNNKKQDMELLMLNQNKSKFLWENIKSNPPKITHPFDKGVTIRGYVSKQLPPNSHYKIQLISLKNNVFDETTIDKNNEFKFEKFYAQDSTVFVFQLKNEKNMSIATKMTTKIVPNQLMYPVPIHFDKTICPIEKIADNNFTFTPPKLKDETIALKEVIIKSDKKDSFKHSSDMSAAASAYKIKDNDYGKVLDFIGRNGYATGVNPETNDVFIISRRNSYLGDNATSPSVYLDGLLLTDFNFLFNLFLSDVDEIYIDQSGASDITVGGSGTIKIFTKDTAKSKYADIKCTTMIATNAFSQNFLFKNSLMGTQKEFDYFGTLGWTPTISLKNNSNFDVKFSKGNQKEYQVSVEGFSDDGQLISEIKKIPITNPNNNSAQ